MALRGLLGPGGLVATVGVGIAAAVGYGRNIKDKEAPLAHRTAKLQLPSREMQLTRLKNEQFDLVVIGAGATGSGVALDAASRGLKVALIERDDFSAGTSGRSTKLLHGGGKLGHCAHH